MKTFNGFYGEAVSLPALYEAYRLASKNKKSPSFKRFNTGLHGNLEELHEELADKTYKPGPYTVFYVDDYKRRRIMAPDFRDHVVHHTVCRFLDQFYEPVFIHDSYACRKGRGTHRGFERLGKFLNKYGRQSYFMKCDVTKYFYSIDHHTLKNILRKKIVDEEFRWLLECIIGSHREDLKPHHLLNPEAAIQDKGIPIGNLTSQYFANIYLNELDYFVKHELGVKHYLRYMDDFIILSHSKDYLNDVWDRIHYFLQETLYLRLEKAKTTLNKIGHGVDFTGYVAHKNFIRVRSRNYQRFKANLKKRIHHFHNDKITWEGLEASFISYLGHLSHTNSNRIKKEVLDLYFNVMASKSGLSNVAGTGIMKAMQGCSA